MENIIIKDLQNGYYRLKPAKGYRLLNTALNAFVSEAVVKEENFRNFKAVEK